MVLVFSSRSIPEGLLVQGLLRAEGIPVEIKGESQGPYRMGPVHLWVPDAFEVQARMLIEEALTAGLQVAEDEDGADTTTDGSFEDEPSSPDG
jgi:hypothetical protein